MSVLTLTSNAPDKSTVTIVNGSTSTGYALSDDGPDFGAVNWTASYAGARGTQGAKPGFGTPDNRTVNLPIRVYGSTKDNMATRIAALVSVVDDMRRYGGQIKWQSTNASYRVFFTVLTAGASLKQWTNRVESNNTADMIATFMCAPYALGDAMDTLDTFDTNTLSTDWTSDINTAGAVVASGSGLVTHTNTTALIWRARNTLKGYRYRDVQVTMKVNTGTSITSAVWGVAARMDSAGADTMLVAELVAGTNVIRLRKFDAGTPTAIGGAGTAITPAVSSTYWVRLRVEGNVVTADAFTTTPTPTGTPTATVSYTMTTAEASKYFDGHAGVRITTASTVTTESYDDWTCEPFTYRLTLAPEEIVLGDLIPGDAPALADIAVSPLGGPAGASAGTTPIWGSAAWHERPSVYNLSHSGDFEDTSIGISGWTHSAVVGVYSAGNSSARDTTAAQVKYGTACLKIVTPASSGSGGGYTSYHRAKKGRTYAWFGWISGSLTTISNVCLGVNGDVTVTTSTAFSLTPVLRCAVWSPTADYDSFTAAVRVAAATATSIYVDAGNIVEVPTIALSAAIVSSSATTMTVYSNPTDLPAVPFNVILASAAGAAELIRVTDTSTTTWTIVRGMEGTTAATALVDLPVIIVPPSRRQYEGRGAVPPTGIIEGESYVSGLSSVTTGALSIVADTAARGGNKLHWSAGAAGSSINAWMIDPSLLWPDDYASVMSGGEVDVEVWARIEMSATLSSPAVRLSCMPEGGLTTGVERYTREYGSATRPLALPSAQNYRYTHLGTLPLFVDRSNPLRWILKLYTEQGSTGTEFNIDYLLLNLSRWRLCNISGKNNDTNFPAFIPDAGAAWSNLSTMTKTLKADGTGYINEPGKPTYPDNGLGRVIELPVGTVANAMVKLSNRVPDDPTGAATGVAAVDEADMDNDAGTAIGTTACYTTSTHFAITPRYAVVRGS